MIRRGNNMAAVMWMLLLLMSMVSKVLCKDKEKWARLEDFELHLMLKTAEQNIKKSSSNVLMVQKGKGMKKKGKGKARVAKAVAALSQSIWNKSSPSLFLL
ncbi:hypothetical protein Scep_028023 [Stephania cephalantha]|uniref:Transmembrane protein n=1 Tax=Stephania cephalantha TaxID=152367 RepID=A0AAP0E947_9MAGN